MADVVLQRKNMVESQVRPSDMTDRRIIRAMLEVPREAFVPSARRAVAYGDLEVKLDDADAKGTPPRVLMAPRIFAKLLQMCSIEPHDDVLIVGAGMGYSAAIVARLAKSVTALEENEAFATHARAALASHRDSGVDVVTGPMGLGVPGKAPFDVILVEGAAQEVPQALLEQLSQNGRLAVVSARGAAGKATLWRRHAGGFDSTEMFDAAALPLPGFEKAASFVF